MKKVSLWVGAPFDEFSASKQIVLRAREDWTVTADLSLQGERAQEVGWSGEELHDIATIISGLTTALATTELHEPVAWFEQTLQQVEIAWTLGEGSEALTIFDPGWHRKLAEFCEESLLTVPVD